MCYALRFNLQRSRIDLHASLVFGSTNIDYIHWLLEYISTWVRFRGNNMYIVYLIMIIHFKLSFSIFYLYFLPCFFSKIFILWVLYIITSNTHIIHNALLYVELNINKPRVQHYSFLRNMNFNELFRKSCLSLFLV